MASSAFLSVFLLNASGEWLLSRHFQTVRAARNWAKWLKSQSYVRDVAVYRGGQGGDRLV